MNCDNCKFVLNKINMKFFLFLILFYFAFRFLSRFLYVYLIRKAKESQSNHHRAKDFQKKKEGEVSIDKIPKNKSKKNNNLGDYVDYEEID